MVYDSGAIVKQRIMDYLTALSFNAYLKNPASSGVLTIEELLEERGKEIEPNNRIEKENIILIVDKNDFELGHVPLNFWVISPYEGGIVWIDEPITWERVLAKNNTFEDNPIRVRRSPSLFSTFTIESNQKQVWKAIGQGWPPLESYRFFIMNDPKVGNRSLNFSRRSFL